MQVGQSRAADERRIRAMERPQLAKFLQRLIPDLRRSELNYFYSMAGAEEVQSSTPAARKHQPGFKV